MTRFVDPWLSLSVGATVLTGLAALQLVVDPAVRTGPSGLRGLSRYAPLLAGGIAAFSAAVAVRLALAASSGQSASTALNTSSDACDEARPSRTGRNSSKRRGTDPKRNDSVSDGTGEPVEGKRWTKKEEIWSEEDEQWIERSKKKDDADEDDDDDDEDPSDADGDVNGQSARRTILFHVKHRFMPKQPDSEGFVIVEFTKRSRHIVECLRTIIRDQEDLFEDKAFINARELFLAKDDIQAHLSKLQRELEERKGEKAAVTVAESSSLRATPEEASAAGTPSVSLCPPVPVQQISAEGQSQMPASVDGSVHTVPAGQDTGEAGFAVTTETATNFGQGDQSADENLERDAEEERPPPSKIPYKELVDKCEHVQVILDFVSEQFASVQAKLDRILPKHMISFKLLWTFIKPGMLVKMVHKSSGETSAFQVRRCAYRTMMTGEQFFIQGTHLVWQGEKYLRMTTSESIPSFTGLRKFASLDCSPLTDTDRAALIERGRLYAKYSGPHYVQYVGALITPGPRPGTYLKSRADGRVMIDMTGYRKMNPSLDIWGGHDYYDDDDDDYYSEDSYGATRRDDLRDYATDERTKDPMTWQGDLKELTCETHFLLTPPTVRGFSFVLKDWGEMLVDSFESITFDERAYDHLELDGDHKTLIRALVDASRDERGGKLISDVVQGKGGGIICVLHGNPGVGKTLTAEAVAELLHRPLYVQGAGDLGVDAHTLEIRLRDTLEIARVWRAVVLIDEADIFLEARSHHEVSRNAMVGVFLRTLEYQQGILFLTTNRVKTFDEAFLSRFSVAIRYPDLDAARRKKVWTKFLVLAGVDVEGAPQLPSATYGGTMNGVGTPRAFVTKRDLNRFAEEPLNGRVVKQTVRTAQALAISNGEPLNAGHIDQILRINKKFQEDFQSAAPEYAVASESWQSRSSLYR